MDAFDDVLKVSRLAAEAPESAKQYLAKLFEWVKESDLPKVTQFEAIGLDKCEARVACMAAIKARMEQDKPLNQSEVDGLSEAVAPILQAIIPSIVSDIDRMSGELVVRGFPDPQENHENWRIIARMVGCDPGAYIEDIYESAMAFDAIRKKDGERIHVENASQQDEQKEHWICKERRILFWFGIEYPPLDRNPFAVVQVLYEAFKKGESWEWVSLETLRQTLKDVRALDSGMAEVFKLRVTTKAKRKEVRRVEKHLVWNVIERRGGAGAYAYRLRRMNIPE